ncbi:amino acid permease-domain-containing protein [Melanogaster broomeanus]|nr:amino acid permease-domain-containing protein [Melanogaster broomeanus]
MSTKEVIAKADEALLAQLGYKQEFKRAFIPLEVFGIAFSIIGLLPSIASVLFYAIPNGGPSAMVWGWAVASIFILCVGMSMAELGSAAPTSGGVSYPCSSIDWGCAVQIAAAASIGSGQTFVATQAQVFGIYVAIVLSHAVVCCLGTAVLARLQNVYVCLNICLCIAVIVGLPAATPKEFMNTASFALGNFSNFNGWSNGYAFFLSFLAPLWTISSFDSSVHISEEAANAATAVPWAIVSAIGIAGVLGWAINVSLAFCMGTDLESILGSPIGQPMAQIFFNSFGQQGTLGIWAIVVLVLASSRQSFAFARDGALPFSSILYRMNSFTGTPVNTVWFVAAVAILLGLLAFAGPEAINAIFAISVTALYIAYSIPIAARFIFTNDFKPGPFSLGVFSLPVAIISVSFMARTPATMNYTVVVLGGILFLSLVWYYFPVYGGVHWFTGPVRNVSADDFTDSASGSSRGREESGDATDLQAIPEVSRRYPVHRPE